MDYHYQMNGNDWGWGFAMMLFWLAFLVIVALLLMRLVRSHETSSNPKTSPLDIAKERYARGEINKEQFEQLKKDLSK